MFAVAEVTTIEVSVSLGDEATLGASELEGPHDVVDFLEVGSAGEEFVDQIFDTHATFLLQVVFNDHIVGDRDTGTVDLQETALVDHVTDSLEGGGTVSDIRFHLSQHVKGGRVNTDESSVVDLTESQETEDLSDIGVELVDTKN